MATNNILKLSGLVALLAFSGCRLFVQKTIIDTGEYGGLKIGSSRSDAIKWLIARYSDSGLTTQLKGYSTPVPVEDLPVHDSLISRMESIDFAFSQKKRGSLSLYFSDSGKVKIVLRWLPSDVFPSEL